MFFDVLLMLMLEKKQKQKKKVKITFVALIPCSEEMCCVIFFSPKSVEELL
jgi:hypothetical protein